VVTISVVIPTRNRKNSLFRLLTALDRQTYPLDEIIIVDSSDEPIPPEAFDGFICRSKIIYLESEPSVCIQRNIGIARACSEFVLLCDDDIEIEASYTAMLVDYLQSHPDAGAASGAVMQKQGSRWDDLFNVTSFVHLVFLFVFQLSIWGRVDSLSPPRILAPLYRFICRFYRKKGNTLSQAGWPLVTQIEPVFVTTIYSLCGAIVRKSWLLNSPFEERLDPNGIGENYGVELGFPNTPAVHVLRTQPIYHHKSPINRLSTRSAYLKRSMALHFFLCTHNHGFSLFTRIWFLWSLFGNLLWHLLTRNGHDAINSLKTLFLIVSRRNPYLRKR